MPVLVITVAVIAAVFVLWTGGQLPEHTASHFSVSGRADGFMSRSAFVPAMLAAVSAMPLAVWFLQVWMARRKKTNIPNRAYWFDAQRSARTVRFLEIHAATFAVALMSFMAAVHWLVVQANRSESPAQLSNTAFFAALLLFISFAVGWVVLFYVRFRKR